MVTRGDAQPRVTVDDPAVLRRDGNVCEQAADQAGAHRDAAHRAHHGFAAVDQVVDDVARLPPLPRTRFEIVDVLLDHREIAAGREHAAGTGQHNGIHRRIAIDVAPDISELRMQDGVGGIHLAVVHRDAEHGRMRAIEAEPRVAGVRVGHERFLLPVSSREYRPPPPKHQHHPRHRPVGPSCRTAPHHREPRVADRWGEIGRRQNRRRVSARRAPVAAAGRPVAPPAPRREDPVRSPCSRPPPPPRSLRPG